MTLTKLQWHLVRAVPAFVPHSDSPLRVYTPPELSGQMELCPIPVWARIRLVDLRLKT
jgi:hypothetical protein